MTLLHDSWKPTIAWDVDDVLNNQMETWFHTQWKKEHEECTLTFDDLTENPPHRVLNAPFEEYIASLDHFRLSRKGENLAPQPTVMEWFRVYGANYRHLALTAVPLRTAHLTAQWVIRHFGAWIRTFHVVPSPRNNEEIPTYDRNKGEFLQWLGRVDLLIADREDNANLARDAGVKALLLPRPWNSQRKRLEEVLGLLNEQL